MTNKRLIILVALVMILSISAPINNIYASGAEPYASAVFASASVRLYSDFSVNFYASTRVVCTISVTSCVMQREINGSWSDFKALEVPDGKSNAITYDVDKDYDSPSSGKYRIKAVFSGGGETVTRYSSAITK